MINESNGFGISRFPRENSVTGNKQAILDIGKNFVGGQMSFSTIRGRRAEDGTASCLNASHAFSVSLRVRCKYA